MAKNERGAAERNGRRDYMGKFPDFFLDSDLV